MGEALAVDLGLDEGGHQVVTGLLFAGAASSVANSRQRPQRLPEHLDRRSIAERLGVRGRDEQIGGLHHALAIGVGHADHVGDRHQRQSLGDELDEVATAGRGDASSTICRAFTRMPSSMRRPGAG